MTLQILETVNYVLVLLYGLFLSAEIAGGGQTSRDRRYTWLLSPVLLVIQASVTIIWDTETVRRLYPLITHLPIVLILIFAFKKRVGVAVTAVTTAYLCCQLPRWLHLAVEWATGSALWGEICYTLSIIPIYLLLHRYFTRAAYDAMIWSQNSLLLFGSLPAVYYLFDYGTAVYSDILYNGSKTLTEFLPTLLIIFYLLFLSAYHLQIRRQSEADLARSMLEAALKQADAAIESRRQADLQTAIYQHDMRHHLNMIQSLLTTGKTEDAEDYIRRVRSDVEAVTPRRFCENETVNLLCSSFIKRADEQETRLSITASLPGELSLSAAELCSILSNALENALSAVSELPQEERWVNLSCSVRKQRLLIEVKNPFEGAVQMKDGLPVNHTPGHGYGCRSIASIAARQRGLSLFTAEDGIFTVRVVIPQGSGRA